MVAENWRRGDIRVFRLSFPMTRTAGARLRAALRDAAAQTEFPDDSLNKLLLGATEACSNALKHGTRTADVMIRSCIHAGPGEMIVRLYYPSEPFIFSGRINPRHSTVPSACRGQYLMSRTLDEVHYYFRKGYTLVRLTKRA